ncbi:ABC transporter ATP-binding protein [Actinoplanes sp. NPDC051346]|uniref:ABC transporter ATP-binding protein n=1 Tax=Actinoplanes sp. NPDC051346 TaxID=3155048 RepID=UPI003428E768
MIESLPVAQPAEVRRAMRRELDADRSGFAVVVVLNLLAAIAGLVTPWLLGRIVDIIQHSTLRSAVARVDWLALVILVVTVTQLLLSRYARYASARLGERTAARIRERFVERSLALPAAVVERVPSGDFIARGTTDVGMVASTLRNAVPDVVISVAQVLMIIVVLVVINPWLGLCGLACFVVIAVVLRWYLRRARSGYLTEGAAGSAIAEVVSTTAAGARTVEALRFEELRIAASESAISESRRARLYTLWLRSVLLPSVDIAYSLPVVGALLLGAVLLHNGEISVGVVVASTFYLRQLVAPLETIMLWVEQLQSSGASYARVEGLATIPRDEPRTDVEPSGDRIEIVDARFSYGHGRDVVRGVTLDVRPGERLAIVGPSGAGKTTLGRLIAGIDRPHTGRITVGGVDVADLVPDRLRRQVALVTQEHHVFQGTLRQNLTLARPDATDEQLSSALAAVDASWWRDLPDDLDTLLGSGGAKLTGSQAQQLALARVVLADPHTLILDEATALLDPSTARNAERALVAVLAGRTVIAIAHRLQTAQDADRVAVMEDGRVIELGSHEDLVAAGGVYAALWRSWHAD